MIPHLRGRTTWPSTADDASAAFVPSPELQGAHSGAYGDAQDAQAQQLSRRFARALTLRGHRPRVGRSVHAAPQTAVTSDPHAAPPVGRKRVAKTKNCAAHKREERRRRRALVQLALSSSGPQRPGGQTASHALVTGYAAGDACQSEEETRLLGAIRNLQADIAQLERTTLLRDSAVISWRTNRTGAALDIANEYVLQLSGGYDPCNPLRAAQSTSGRQFMEKLLLPDVLCRDFQGLEPFMNQWEKYTIFHDDFMCRVSGMRVLKDSDNLVSIYIASDFLLTFTDNTVKYLYPALMDEAQRDARTRSIVDRLIDSRVRLPLDIVLHFNEQGRVFAFESRSHLATALLEVLEDPTAAMHVFCLACMTVDGHWKLAPDPDAQERQRRVPHMLL